MVAVLAALGLQGCSTGSDEAAATPLPEATLIELDTGEPTAWPDDGTPLVINLWASWCTPCRKEMPAFDEVSRELDGQLTIVGVTDESDLDAARDAADQAGVTYPLLVDEDQTVLVDLEITGLPGTVFVDAEGAVVGRHLGALTASQLRQEIEERYGITT